MNNKYIKSFDYLRVIAVIGVLLYHLMPNYVPSGYLGVVIFFVLAGFLTMRQIVERDKGVGLSLGVDKIKNKIIKLYPALLTTILIVTIYMLLQFKNFLIGYPVDAISSVLSVNNYAQILKNESYFEAMNSIKPLTHIWALSLEFQFYVLFYLIVYPFYTKSNKHKFSVVFIIITIISIVLALNLAKHDVNLTRIYYGVDTRIATFLIGVLAAQYADDIASVISKNQVIITILSVVIALVMIYLMFVNFSTDYAVISILIIYSFVCGVISLLLFSIKDAKGAFDVIVNYFVKRSYIIYLIHYPIIIFANRYLAHINVNLNVYFIVLIILSLVISEIVYRLVNILFKDKGKNAIKIIVLSLIIICISIGIRLKVGTVDKTKDLNDTTWLTETTASNDYLDDIYIDVATVSEVNETSSEHLDDENVDTKHELTAEELNAYSVQTVFKRINSVNAVVGEVAEITRDEFLEFKDMNITFIGDSVTQGSKGSLSVYFPNGRVNAAGNRELKDAVDIYNEMKSKNEIGDILVVALGTNSTKDIRADVLEELYNDIGDKIMIVLTVAIPSIVEEQKRNRAIIDFANAHDNCHIADWHAAIKTHSEYFVGDDTHPKDLGTDIYAQIIFKTAMDGLRWRKIGNEWQYFGSENKAQFAIELDKNVGDIVTFGEYYINNKDEKEPIEWIIVDKDDNLKTEVLLSKYVLERKKISNVYASTLWQKSDIRKWLNDEFYKVAFDTKITKFILTSALTNHRNPEFKSIDSGTTYDNVYLPSYEELVKYDTNDNLKAKGTKYFVESGGYVDQNGYADWWGRTLGDADNHMMNVTSNGEINIKGDYVTTDDFGIRPMIKVTTK